MAKAIVVRAFGGPSVMKWRAVAVGDPGPGEVLIRQTAIGFNFLDISQRSGKIPTALPFTPGQEAAGIVEATGRGIGTLKPGDRVAYATPERATGSYAEYRVMEAEGVVKLPPDIPDELAAAVMLKGMTAEFLLRQTTRVRPGETILVHAAAGATGMLLCQWARHLGATVIGTVGSAEKAKLARAHGCDHAIDYRRTDFAGQARRITKGRGVDVVFDAIGIDTFEGSLASLRPRGLLVLYGSASGRPGPFELMTLSRMGSLFVTFASIRHYTAAPAAMRRAAREIFRLIRAGALTPAIGQRYALEDAARCHRDGAQRKTTGSAVMFP